MNRLAIRLCIGSMLVISGALLSDAQTSSVLHSFTGTATDGDAPNSLIEAQDGNYYGTTAFGGSAGSCTDSNNNTVGCGTVFKLSSGTVTVLYSFSGGADGGQPNGIIQGTDGNLYGVAAFGGSSQGNGKCLAGTVDTGCGTIFEIAPSSPPAAGKLVPIYNFTGGSDGAYPNPLTMGTGGVLYGSALDCSQCSTSDAYGVLFSFQPGRRQWSHPNDPFHVWHFQRAKWIELRVSKRFGPGKCSDPVRHCATRRRYRIHNGLLICGIEFVWMRWGLFLQSFNDERE